MSSPSRPVTRVSKREVLSALFGSWDDIDLLMTDVGEEQWRLPTPLPGWTVHSVVAHMAGTETMLMGKPTPEVDVDVSALDHVRNDIGALNEAWIQAMDSDSGVDLLQRFRTVTGKRRAALSAMSDDDWDAVGFTPAGPDSYGRFMRIRVFDCWMHDHDIRQALDRPPSDADLDNPAARTALDEMAGSMAFVVGKLGKAPDGSKVAIDLTGPLARTIRVAVDGRAALVDDFGGADPTTVIRMDAVQFTRLCGGRPMFDTLPSDIAFEGDAEVGQRIVEHLNYVI